MARKRAEEDSLSIAKLVLGVVAAALTVVIKILELLKALPPLGLRWVNFGPATVIVIAYLAAYIVFDIWDSFRNESYGWLMTRGLAFIAVPAWFLLLFRSQLALGYLVCYILYDGLDAAYYGWFDRTFGPFPDWGKVLLSAIIALLGVVVLIFSWRAF